MQTLFRRRTDPVSTSALTYSGSFKPSTQTYSNHWWRVACWKSPSTTRSGPSLNTRKHGNGSVTRTPYYSLDRDNREVERLSEFSIYRNIHKENSSSSLFRKQLRNDTFGRYRRTLAYWTVCVHAFCFFLNRIQISESNIVFNVLGIHFDVQTLHAKSLKCPGLNPTHTMSAVRRFPAIQRVCQPAMFWQGWIREHTQPARRQIT